jgi:hypothetical protein
MPCALLYTAVHGCTRLYKAVHGCTRLYTAVHGCTRLYTAVHGSARLYTAYTALHWCGMRGSPPGGGVGQTAYSLVTLVALVALVALGIVGGEGLRAWGQQGLAGLEDPVAQLAVLPPRHARSMGSASGPSTHGQPRGTADGRAWERENSAVEVAVTRR